VIRLRLPDLVRGGFLYGAVAGLALLLGVLLAKGHIYLAVAGLLGAVLLVVLGVQSLGFRALSGWVVLGVVAFPFIRYPQGHSQLTFDRVWILGLAGAMLITGVVHTRRAAASRRVAIWMVVLGGAMLLRGLLTSSSRSYAIGLAVDAGVLPAILFFAARRMVTDREGWDRLLGSFVVAGAILGLIAAAERALGFQLATLSGGSVTVGSDVGVRVSGPYANDDVLAVALLMCLAATIVWIQFQPRARLTLGSTAVLLELVGITLTFFRGAWIGALVVIVVGIGLRPRKYARLLGVLALVAVVAGVVLLRAQDTKGLAQRLNNTQNVSGRVATYQQALELFARHPLAGVGLGQFAAAQKAELPSNSVGGVSAVSFAHNSYLDSLAEGGLLVSLPFLALTLAVGLMVHRFREVAREDRHDVLIGAMITGATLAYLLMSLEETVITSATASDAFLALLLGACAARLDALENEKLPVAAAPTGTAGPVAVATTPGMAK
jgi:hypothetical protein